MTELLFSLEHQRGSSRFDDALLDDCRGRSDELGDRAVEALIAAGFRGSGDLFEALDALAAREPGPARELLEQAHTRPRWADVEAMELSHHMALQNVLPSGLALLAGSLVESYAGARGAKVLVRTGRLRGDEVVRRVYETAQFVSDIPVCGGPLPGTRAWRNIIKVRLVHAFVRRGLRRSPGWQADAWGLPINQEDYAMTLVLFSHVYRRAMMALGVPMSEEVCDANHLVWRYVGHLMGVDEELLTHDRADERALYIAISSRQFQPDDDSRALTRDLLHHMSAKPPFFLPESALHAMGRAMIGERLADALELRRGALWRAPLGLLRGSVRAQNKALSWTAQGAQWTEAAGRRVIRASLRHGLGGDDAQFGAPR